MDNGQIHPHLGSFSLHNLHSQHRRHLFVQIRGMSFTEAHFLQRGIHGHVEFVRLFESGRPANNFLFVSIRESLSGAEPLCPVTLTEVDTNTAGFHLPWQKAPAAIALRVIGVTLRRFGVQRLRAKISVIDAPRPERHALLALSGRRRFLTQTGQVKRVLSRQALHLMTRQQTATSR